MNISELYGPWAVIAGATEGTGRCFAHRIAATGVNCILIARREPLLRTLADELRSQHRVECVTASVDLSETDASQRVVDAVGTREVGLFVSNAGADTNAAFFLDCEISAWARLAQLNALTMMHCCHHFGALMRQRRRGGLLLVNSGACYTGASELAVYSASKAFVLCFSEGLWAELRPYGVDVLTLVLGQTDTPAYRKYMADKGLSFPTNTASPDEVARVGLERLPHGPVHNWGHTDDQSGFSPLSAAAVRQRVLMIDEMRKGTVGAGK